MTEQNERATPEDVEWLAAIADQKLYPRHWRILNSLRASSPDRERLARALYIIGSTERREAGRAEFWDSKGDAAVITREAMREDADRLLRVLGGFPVAGQQPFGWYVYRLSDGTGAFVFRKPDESPGTQVVTPLYAVEPGAAQEDAGKHSIHNALWSEARGEGRAWLESLPDDVRKTVPGGLLALLYISNREPTEEDHAIAAELARSLAALESP